MIYRYAELSIIPQIGQCFNATPALPINPHPSSISAISIFHISTLSKAVTSRERDRDFVKHAILPLRSKSLFYASFHQLLHVSIDKILPRVMNLLEKNYLIKWNQMHPASPLSSIRTDRNLIPPFNMSHKPRDVGGGVLPFGGHCFVSHTASLHHFYFFFYFLAISHRSSIRAAHPCLCEPSLRQGTFAAHTHTSQA